MAETPFIETHSEALPVKAGNDLQLWLSKPEAATLTRIIESKIKDHLAQATNNALKGAGGAPLKMNVADEHLQAARRYKDFLNVLTEIKEQNTPFTVIKWT